MQRSGWAILISSLIAAAACSKDPAPPLAAGAPARDVPQVAHEAPLPDTDTNLAAANMGGAVEEVTDNYGPGFLGRRLVDGLLTPAWIVDTREKPQQFWLTYPQEATLSFFERQPAVIKAVTIALADPATLAPKDIEIWTSMGNSRTAASPAARLSRPSRRRLVNRRCRSIPSRRSSSSCEIVSGDRSWRWGKSPRSA